MTWDAIGAIGEILGAAAVVTSLLYLGFQIPQSARWEKQQAFQSTVAQLIG